MSLSCHTIGRRGGLRPGTPSRGLEDEGQKRHECEEDSQGNRQEGEDSGQEGDPQVVFEIGRIDKPSRGGDRRTLGGLDAGHPRFAQLGGLGRGVVQAVALDPLFGVGEVVLGRRRRFPPSALIYDDDLPGRGVAFVDAARAVFAFADAAFVGLAFGPFGQGV